MDSENTDKRSGRDRRKAIAAPRETSLERRVADRRGLQVKDAVFWDWVGHFLHRKRSLLHSQLVSHQIESRRSGADRRMRSDGPPAGMRERRDGADRRVIDLHAFAVEVHSSRENHAAT